MSKTVAKWTEGLFVDTLKENLGIVCPAALNPDVEMLMLALEVHTTEAASRGSIIAVGLSSGISYGHSMQVVHSTSVLFRVPPEELTSEYMVNALVAHSGAKPGDENAARQAAHRLIEENDHRGVDPQEGMRRLGIMLEKSAFGGVTMCGQTLTSFALPRLESYGGLGKRYTNIVDTGMLIKSAAIPTRALDPTPYEFYLRVAQRALRGVRYSIDGFVVPVMFGESGLPVGLSVVTDARSRAERHAELALHAFQLVREEALRA